MAKKMIEERLAKTLSSIDELNGRVFPIQPKKGISLPFCVYISTGTIPDDSLGGFMSSQSARMEINVLHTSYRRVKQLAEKVIAKIKAIDYATVYFEDFKPELYEPEIKAYRKIIYVKFQF